jgi:hypothetical protein
MNSVYAKPFRFLAKRVILIVGFHTISPEDLEFVDRLIETGNPIFRRFRTASRPNAW